MRALDKGDQLQAGVNSYNLGNFHRVGGTLAQAFKYYNLARKHNPKYLEQDYFMREVGNVLFLKMRYRKALYFFQKNLELNPEDILTYSFKGDALMYSGNYGDAMEAYDIFLMRADPKKVNTHEVTLEAHMFSYIDRKWFSFKADKKKPEQAAELADINNLSEGEDFAESFEQALIEYDMMSVLAWFNLVAYELD